MVPFERDSRIQTQVGEPSTAVVLAHRGPTRTNGRESRAAPPHPAGLAEAPSRPSRESLKTPSRAESRVAHENPESLIHSEIAAQWAKK
jgi:hypothetical protein